MFPELTMRFYILASLLTFTFREVGAYSRSGSTDISKGTPAPKIKTTEQGAGVIVKLDCAGCPFVIRHGYPRRDEEIEYPSRPNSLVRRGNADEVNGLGRCTPDTG